jgi:sister chromatid cohesion protein DCC1
MATVAFGDEYSLGSSQFSLIQLPTEIFKKVRRSAQPVPGRVRTSCSSALTRASLYVKQVQADPTTTFKLKGREGDDAVLVTEDQTFLVRRGETSNTQMLFECPLETFIGEGGADGTYFAVGNVMQHLELMPASARLHELPKLLERRPYEGPDLDAEFDLEGQKESRLSRSDIEGMLQASAGEIDAELRRLGALEIGGKLCSMGQRYESNLMTIIFAAAVLRNWDLGALSLEECLEDADVAAYPRTVVATFLDKYAAAAPSGGDAMETDGADGGKRALDIARLAVFRAEELLDALPITQRMTVDEFMSRWRTMLPSDAEVGMQLLHGRAIAEPKGARTLIKKLALGDLPRDVKGLFRVLFAQRAQWSKEELVPYLAGVVGPGQSADALLLKHTRVTRVPGSDAKTYSARV